MNVIPSNIKTIATPCYLDAHYRWAYVTPRAVKLFERPWLVNLILWGNFGRLRDIALNALGDGLTGKTLQIACVYGDLTSALRDRHAPQGSLDVVDVLPVQLQNLRRKLAAAGKGGPAVDLYLADSASLGFAPDSYDRVLLFFLLHEQPEAVRRATLTEALRVLKPGGKLVIVDYHRPPVWNPMRLVMQAVLGALEPFALSFWRRDISAWFPTDLRLAAIRRHTVFGGLYQIVEIIR